MMRSSSAVFGALNYVTVRAAETPPRHSLHHKIHQNNKARR